HALDRRGRKIFYVADDVHPQSAAVVRTRALPLGLAVEIGPAAAAAGRQDIFGLLLQYPATDGRIVDYRALVEGVHAADVRVVAACDLLALTLLAPPGEWGADM